MSRTKSAGSVAATVLAALCALTVAVGCSSSTSGSGSAGAAVAGGSSAPSSAPPATQGGGGSSSGGRGSSSGSDGSSSSGGSSSAFCADWQAFGGTPDLTPGSALKEEIAKFEKADADAPAAIKSDMDTFLAAVRGIASGHAPSADYTTAVQHVVLYISEHCH